MRPFHHSSAPSVDRGVLARMKRLDRDLFVTFSPYVLDTLTGQPIYATPKMDPETGLRARCGPVPEPMYYLWINGSQGVALVSMYKHFGHQQLIDLEGCLARTHTPKDMAGVFLERQATAKARGQAAFRDRHEQTLRANRKKIADLAFEGKREERQGKMYSAPGLSRRSTPGTITPDARECGWELPSES